MKPTYELNQQITGEIVTYGYNEYRLKDENGVNWYTNEATVDGYYLEPNKAAKEEET